MPPIKDRIPLHNIEAGGDRRRFLKLMMASVSGAGAGLAGCVKEPAEEIVPYVNQPEGVVPGVPSHYSSVFTRNGYGYGTVVQSHQGRPTKVEGNPRHPASLGGSDPFMQAELLNLYDPDRSRAIQERGRIRSLGELQQVLAGKRAEWRAARGRGLHILTPQLGSPSMAALLQSLLERYPAARWHQWQPVNDDNALQGARLAFGRDLAPRYRFRAADVVLQLDGDFLSELPGSLCYARDFAARRRPGEGMSRLYVIESTPALAGAMADHRHAANIPRVELMARYLMDLIAGSAAPDRSGLDGGQRRWVEQCARDLLAHRGRGLVLAGRKQAPAVHAIAHWLNHVLDNAGGAVRYHAPVPVRSELLLESLGELQEALDAGEVDSLICLDCNPVFDAPADFRFAAAFERVSFTLHMGLYFDETAALSDWHLPLSHALESWGDARAFEGSAAIQQPLISPLHGSVSPLSLLGFLAGGAWRSDYELVRGWWRQHWGGGGFEEAWRKALLDGVIEGSAAAELRPVPRDDLPAALPQAPVLEGGAPVLQFEADPRIWDGRYANNAWLQELPKPLSKLVWGNALLLSPALAAELGVHEGDVLRIEGGTEGMEGEADAVLEAPAYALRGMPDDAVSLSLGYGRQIAAGRPDHAVSRDVGVNAYPLRLAGEMDFRAQVGLAKTGRRIALARAQQHDSMEGRHPVRHAGLEEYRQHPGLIRDAEHARDPSVSLYPEPDPAPFANSGYAWGMSIDLNACIGCGACTLACQAENNIPVVGRDQVLAGRLMHWLRIDRYYSEDEAGEDLRTWFQPMLCQHCENAPCEYVCPVGATLHDSEGLNVMIYNRCIGTRDCSQNCPYKVRRFNFLEYNYDTPYTEVLAPMRNPDVTVRSRGVMEKCTYCLQRISAARREAKKEGRKIRDGEVLTACQQACPTRAIVFGDISDPESRVSREKRDLLSYHVLAELNTRPRTSYKARIHNAGPGESEGTESEGEQG